VTGRRLALQRNGFRGRPGYLAPIFHHRLSFRVIHVIPAIPAFPVRPKSGHSAKGACLMSTVAITLAISSVAPVEAQQQNGGAVWDRARKLAPHHLRFFSKTRKGFCGTRKAEGISSWPHHVCYWGHLGSGCPAVAARRFRRAVARPSCIKYPCRAPMAESCDAKAWFIKIDDVWKTANPSHDQKRKSAHSEALTIQGSLTELWHAKSMDPFQPGSR